MFSITIFKITNCNSLTKFTVASKYCLTTILLIVVNNIGLIWLSVLMHPLGRHSTLIWIKLLLSVRRGLIRIHFSVRLIKIIVLKVVVVILIWLVVSHCLYFIITSSVLSKSWKQRKMIRQIVLKRGEK